MVTTILKTIGSRNISGRNVSNGKRPTLTIPRQNVIDKLKLGLAPKDLEQRSKWLKTGPVRLSDHLVRLSERITVTNHIARFLVADWSLTSSLKRPHVRLSERVPLATRKLHLPAC
ncbi:hypothetical protein MTR_0240s0020 [Medicago truncatula]|uniref:Uncharacterized protein n=1 Tax=Medicago truncatula TaxID=3880 RepID=A0A072TFI3_MEDTR|nr:hypothetical protein MTR_0240s0020 [Medicago truncatula]